MNPIDLLAQILSNNIGNRLTVELASGIVAVFNQALEKPDQVTPTESE